MPQPVITQATPINLGLSFVYGPPPPLHMTTNRLADANGNVVQLQGAMFSRMESHCGDSGLFTAANIAVMRDVWNMNCVKIPINPKFWISGCPHAPGDIGSVTYRQQVQNAINTALNQGMYVIVTILDYYLPTGGNWPAPDINTLYCLQGANNIPGIAQIYANQQAVIFETFSEPYGITDAVWLNGGAVSWNGNNYTAIGIQDQVTAINTVAPNAVVLIGCHDDNAYPGYVNGSIWPTGTYGWSLHFYNTGDNANSSLWNNTFGYLANNHVVVACEFGDTVSGAGVTTWLNPAMAFMRQHIAGYTAWRWLPEADNLLDPTNATPYATGVASTYGAPIQTYYTAQVNGY
jgi:hypothetical protein